MNEKLLVTANLWFQCALLLIVIIAGYLSRFKHKVKLHCLILRIAVLLQVAAIIVIMLPAMRGYIQTGERTTLFNTLMWVHHILGLGVILIWVYINLVFQGMVKALVKLPTLMRTAFFLWILVLLMGIYLYRVTWI
jgi:putative membrane protein